MYTCTNVKYYVTILKRTNILSTVTHLYLHTAQILRASIQDDTTERCEKL